jgi:acyl-CoA thioesterase
MSGDATGDRLTRLAGLDRYAAALGAEYVEGGPGRIVLRLRVSGRHLNFYGYCHGGAIFSLADSAFGLASNAHGEVSVAIDAHLTFSTAVQAGEVLTATATELTRTRRTGTYRVEVRREGDGALVSHFTGTVYRTGKADPTGCAAGGAQPAESGS